MCSLGPHGRDGYRGGDGGDSVISKVEVDIDIEDDDVDEVATQLARMDTGISLAACAGEDDELGRIRSGGGGGDDEDEATAVGAPHHPQEEATAVETTTETGDPHGGEEIQSIHLPITDHDGESEHKTLACKDSSRPPTHDSCSRSTSASASASVSAAANMVCPDKSPEPQQQRAPAPSLRQIPLSLRSRSRSCSKKEKEEEEDYRMRMPSTPFFCRRPDLIRVITFEQAVKELREHIGASRHMEAS